MKNTTNVLLLVIALALVAIAIEPLLKPRPTEAQVMADYPLYFEPGVFLLRAPDGTSQIYGKMAIDLRTGKIWGFPTYGQQPYPVDISTTKPITSRPVLLGRFAIEDTDR
ncbi:MAG: hypothetical protein JOZ33_01265 [Acidobacteriaceae bacterium]|nr:hypothetical protein [Acidobacteriaceae bacterium]